MVETFPRLGAARQAVIGALPCVLDHVVKTLKDFKAKDRNNDAGNMTSVASTLSEEDIDNLAHYIASLN
jgi:mono/diheme cytochrome c family protein